MVVVCTARSRNRFAWHKFCVDELRYRPGDEPTPSYVAQEEGCAEVAEGVATEPDERGVDRWRTINQFWRLRTCLSRMSQAADLFTLSTTSTCKSTQTRL